MIEHILNEIVMANLRAKPNNIERCSIGHGNYVFILDYGKEKYIIRLSEEKEAYKKTVYWINLLKGKEIPVPEVISEGEHNGYAYIILSYIEGKDLGVVYSNLDDKDKQKIAGQVVDIQNKVATLPKNNKYGSIDMYKDNSGTETWKDYIKENLLRSRERIIQNGIFSCEKVDALIDMFDKYEDYFSSIESVAFLDDISNKNLLIEKGEVSGIVDIDWLGFGDKLLYVALTNMALLDMEVDTNYVEYILNEMHATEVQRDVLIFYTLMYCVDFMGEKGMKFQDKKIHVDNETIEKLNKIYEKLFDRTKGRFFCPTFLE